MAKVPEGSVYLWMYRQGLAMREPEEVSLDLWCAGRNVREKDWRNYLAGRRNACRPRTGLPWEERRSMKYSDYPLIREPVPERSWVPCNKDNKPMIPWGAYCMSYVDAACTLGCRYLAQNVRAQRFIVIDVDGDHDGKPDLDLLRHYWQWLWKTSAIAKPKLLWEYGCACDECEMEMPASFHLMFQVDREIPTMHFPKVDVIGNRRNSLRYLKNKVPNNLDPIPMTDEIWRDVVEWAAERKGRQ